MQNILIFGLGYVAKSFILKAYNYKIFITTRSNNTNDRIINFNDVVKVESLLKSKINILITAPPDHNGDPVYLAYSNLIEKYAKNINWIGYLSSTSVYGKQPQNIWVTERTELSNTNSQQGLNRIIAENQWLNLFHKINLPVHIFRLAGIYGPNRNSISRIQKNSTIVFENNISSRIHIDDINRALLKSMLNSTPGEIFNISDNYPCATYKSYIMASKFLNKEIKLIPKNIYNSNFYNKRYTKKICSNKIKSMLNISWKYSAYYQEIKKENSK